MITIRNLKLNEYKDNEITIEQLKEVLLRFYYGNLYKNHPEIFDSDMKREMIITEVKGSYGSISSVVFSVNGSPPKGEAILFINSHNKKYYVGSLVCMGNGNISNRIEMIILKK